MSRIDGYEYERPRRFKRRPQQSKRKPSRRMVQLHMQLHQRVDIPKTGETSADVPFNDPIEF